MITTIAAILLCTLAYADPPPPSAPVMPPAHSAPAPAPAPAPHAAPAPAARTAPAVHASTAAAPSASAAAAFGVSTYTVSTLYTGDQVRDPFLPPGHPVMSAGAGEERTKSQGVDIHVLELRGILKDEQSAFAIFTTDTGATLILRGSRLYDEHNKRVPGITGSINIKQKRAVLITADKDRQPYHLGEIDAGKKDDESGGSNESEETGSGRSP